MNKNSLPPSTVADSRILISGVATKAENEGRVAPIITQYWRTLLRWKWLIVSTVVGAVLIGILATVLATAKYTATTRLEINREGSRIVKISDLQPAESPGDMEFYQTQYGLLKSRALAERIARQLRLTQNRDFFTMFGYKDAAATFTETGNGGAPGRALRERRVVEILLDNVNVSPIRLSRLVDVSFTSPDPTLSARVAGAWGTGFINYNLERKFQTTAFARQFLEKRLEQLKKRLEDSERQLVQYASNEAIINIPVEGGGGADHAPQERSLTADSLVALNNALSQATAERIASQARRSGSDGTAPEALSSTTISELRQRRAEAAAEYSRLMTQFEPGYPAAKALAAQIQQLDQSIAREQTRVSSSLSTTYQDAVRREQALQDQLKTLKDTFLNQRRRSIQYNIYQREADTNRQLYDGLLQRYKEIGVAGGVGENNVAIVDAPEIPVKPSSPRPLINLLLSLVIGLVVGVALALIREQVDETITDPSELEEKIGLPLLGVVPSSDNKDLLTEVRNPKSSLMEAYLSIQTNLDFSTDHGIPRTLAVTSTRAAEGKSTTAYALAHVISRRGLRTVIVDADMRSPSLHTELSIHNNYGLSNFLSGSDDLTAFLQPAGDGGLMALTAGPQPPNAAELLRTDRFGKLLRELAEHFDHVVIDSPPVLGLADAPILTSQVEGTVFVVEARHVNARMARIAVSRLRQGKAKLLGSVLTKFEDKHSQYGYGYGYGYGRETDA